MSKHKGFKYVGSIVAAYWLVSISMVYLNKVFLHHHTMEFVHDMKRGADDYIEVMVTA